MSFKLKDEKEKLKKKDNSTTVTKQNATQNKNMFYMKYTHKAITGRKKGKQM